MYEFVYIVFSLSVVITKLKTVQLARFFNTKPQMKLNKNSIATNIVLLVEKNKN